MAEEQKECNENIEAIGGAKPPIPEENNEINTVKDEEVKPQEIEKQNEKIEKEIEKQKPKRTPKRVKCELCNKEMNEPSFPKHYKSCQIKQAKPKVETRPLRKNKDNIDIIPIEPIIESKPEPVIESKPEPVIESKPEPVIESKPEPIIEIKPEPRILTRAEKLSLMVRNALP
jgi:hypothetical protein